MKPKAMRQQTPRRRKSVAVRSRRRFFRTSLTGLLGGLAALWGMKETAAATTPSQRRHDDRARLREMGIDLGFLPPGRFNAITDVEGVRVGHTTKISGSGELNVGVGPVRTGVTVIMPHGGNIFKENLAVGHYVLNGNGEMTGFARDRAAGTLETPIFLTGTANVGIVYDAALTYLLAENPEIGVTAKTPVPVVAECWDSLGDIEGRHITEQDVLDAIAGARSGPVEEGAVGGGTGMRSYGFKAGIGTASRVLAEEQGGYTVGVLVNANHSARRLLRIDGVPVGEELLQYPEGEEEKSKSIILVAATDAPLLPIQLQRLCKRMSLGLARTGSVSTHGSGDIFIAFSTANRLAAGADTLRWAGDGVVSSLWEAAVEATEEAALNALTAAPTMDGAHGIVRHGLPLDRLVAIMKKYNRL